MKRKRLVRPDEIIQNDQRHAVYTVYTNNLVTVQGCGFYIFFSIISELNKEFPAFWLVERFLIWRYLNRSRQFIEHFGGPATKLATFAISASKFMADNWWMN